MGKIGLGGLVIFAFVLAGCQQTKKIFGMAKNPPNEFTVMQRAPLEVPPHYHLRPPRPGVARPQEAQQSQADQKAKKALTSARASNRQPNNHQLLSKSEKHLLAKAGAEKVKSGIRDQVDTEAYAENQGHGQKNWLRKNLPFYKAPQEKALINPHKEKERLDAIRLEKRTS